MCFHFVFFFCKQKPSYEMRSSDWSSDVCSSDLIVTWAIGHLLEDFLPHDYDPAYQKWDLAHLPILPQKFQKKPAGDKTTQLNIVTRLIKQAREIVIATDAGREGEAIAWYILDYAGWRGPCLRFWTH